MASFCLPERRCRLRECEHCGPIRAGDEYHRFKANIDHYGGRVKIVAVSAPGQDVLPWDDGMEDVYVEGGSRALRRVGRFVVDRRTGEMLRPGRWSLGTRQRQRRVSEDYATGWNQTASARYARLWKAATLSGDRLVRRHGHEGVLPRRVAVVWSLQTRGVWHVHEAFPAQSAVELLWSRHVVDFIDHVRKREFRMSGRERWNLLELERWYGVTTRGFYGFGFVDRNPLRKLGAAHFASEKSASYMAKNASEYLGKNASENAAAIGRRMRTYVSRRLTMETGITLTNLRRKRVLWYRLTYSEPLPEWEPEMLERIWSLLIASQSTIRGP